MPIVKIKLLLVEDSPVDRRIFAEHVKNIGDLEINYDYVETLAAALKMLTQKAYDVVVLDLGLPDSNGIGTFYELQKHSPDISIIIMSGLGVQEIAQKAVTDGAHDYLIKGEIDANQLVKSIRFAINRQEARSKMLKRINPSTHQPSTANITKSLSTNTQAHPLAEIEIGLINAYEKLIACLLDANLKKNSQTSSMIQSLAKQAQQQGMTPLHIDSLRKQQTKIKPENTLLFMINADIIAELVVLTYEKKLSMKTRAN